MQAFQLNVATSFKLESTIYDPSTKLWSVKFDTPSGKRTVNAKHFVQATGVGSQVPNSPKIENEEAYQGKAMHSSGFQNGKELMAEGVKVRNAQKVPGWSNTDNRSLSSLWAQQIRPSMFW